jgi:hypothetical protein
MFELFDEVADLTLQVQDFVSSLPVLLVAIGGMVVWWMVG